jgi:hypothetical protein
MLMDPLPVLLGIFMFIGIFFFIGIFMSTGTVVFNGAVVFIGNVMFFAMPPLSVTATPLKESINNIDSSVNPANM